MCSTAFCACWFYQLFRMVRQNSLWLTTTEHIEWCTSEISWRARGTYTSSGLPTPPISHPLNCALLRSNLFWRPTNHSSRLTQWWNGLRKLWMPWQLRKSRDTVLIRTISSQEKNLSLMMDGNKEISSFIWLKNYDWIWNLSISKTCKDSGSMFLDCSFIGVSCEKPMKTFSRFAKHSRNARNYFLESHKHLYKGRFLAQTCDKVSHRCWTKSAHPWH